MISVKNYNWHKVWHANLMGNQAYLALPLDARGALQTLRNLAGQTNNNGSLRMGGVERMTYEDVLRYLIAIPGSDARRSRTILQMLIVNRFLICERRGKETLAAPFEGGIILVANWLKEQLSPPSYEAEKKRKQRADQAFGRDGSGGCRPSAPPSSDSGAVQEEQFQEGTCPPEAGDMSPRTRTEIETEIEKETLVSLNPVLGTVLAETKVSSVQVGGAEGRQPPAEGDGSDLFNDDPVRAYCTTMEDFSAVAKSTAGARLRSMCEAYGMSRGVDMFRQALAEMRVCLREGKVPKTCRDGRPMQRRIYFEGIFKAVLGGRI
jgi:hypothetical protein